MTESLLIANDHLEARLLPLGAALTDLRLKETGFSFVLGAEDPARYAADLSHFGAVMGPVANRIGGARAEIDGTEHTFEANEGGLTCLHSASAGLHHLQWEVEEHDETSVTFRIDVAHGTGGFPGNRTFRARYALEGSTLIQDLSAETDAPTLVALAHHGYWTVQPPENWGGQTLTIAADRYLPTDAATLPTGEIRPVEGTPFDFRTPRTLEVGETPDFDHNFCLADAPRDLTFALRLASPETGLSLEIHTTAPGMQVFSMHKFGTYGPTNHGGPYPHRAGLAFEPQMWPDAPGRDVWPDILLRPGDTHLQRTEYRIAKV